MVNEPAHLNEDWWPAVETHQEAMRMLTARMAPRSESGDVVQDALAAAWRHRQSFDPRRGTLRTWLLAIVANASVSAHRKLNRFPSVVGELPESSLPARSERSAAVTTAVTGLSERQRLAVDCFYFVGLSVRETAEVMRCSEGTVKSILSDARSRIRAELEKS